MKITTIDIGTNSVRSLNAEFDGKKIKDRQKNLMTTRIGMDVDKTHQLREDRMSETVDAIVEFTKEAKSYGSEEIYIMATSAVRDANNREIFIEKVKEKTGHKIEVLSGVVEARCGMLGVLSGSKQDGITLIVDIGGGSTELILCKDDEILHEVSMDIGCVRMTDRFFHSNKVTAEQLKEITNYIDEVTSKEIDIIKEFDISKVIGIGGTASTYGSMVLKMQKYDGSLIHNLNIENDDIVKINKELIEKDLDERKRIIGLAEKRADIILAGGIILNIILSKLNISNLVLSDYDNLEGYLIYQKEELDVR